MTEPSATPPTPPPGDNPLELRPAPVRNKTQRVQDHLKSIMIAGVITLFPLFVSLYILSIIYNLATAFTHPIASFLLQKGLPSFWPGITAAAIDRTESFVSPVLALILSILVVYLLGILGTFVVGRRLLEALEHFVENLPLVKGIYGTTKQVIGVFKRGSEGGSGFQRVVLVEFPRLGTWTVAFVTNTITDTSTNTRMVCTFIPMTPNPTSGFFQLFPEDHVRNTDWTVDQGIKIVLSGGLLAPDQLQIQEKPPV